MTATPHGRLSHSQFGEDLLLDHIFTNIVRIDRGSYLDIGGFDPYYLSNTALLHARGWRGINIDANPDSIAKFNAARPEDVNIHCGISAESATLPFFLFRAAASNTFDPAVRDQNIARGWQLLGSVMVPTHPAMTVIAPHRDRFPTFDYINIDIEGLDEVALRSLDLKALQPTCVSIETSGLFLSRPEAPVTQHLRRQGYRLYSHVGITTFFLKAQD